MKLERILGTLSLTVLSLRAPLARACTWEPVALHQITPALAAGDTLAPSPPVVLNVDVTRRSGLSCDGERCVQNSCGDTGMVTLELAPGKDDQTPPGGIGYRLELVSGSVPDSLRQMIGLDLAARTPLFLRLGFDEVVGLDATLRVVAIDAAGNESAPSDPFVLAFDGCTLTASGQGCEDQFEPEPEPEPSAASETKVLVDSWVGVPASPDRAEAPPARSGLSCSVLLGAAQRSEVAAVLAAALGLLAAWRRARPAR